MIKLKTNIQGFRVSTQSWLETSTDAAPPSVRTEKKSGGDHDLGAETGTETGDGKGLGPVTGRGRGVGPGRGKRENGTRTAGTGTPRRGRGSQRVRSLTRPGTPG